MKTLDLEVMSEDQSLPVKFQVTRMVNAGYVGRNLEAVKAHIEELRREGVTPPPSVPMLFPVLSDNITTGNEIEVVGSKTSGEVEFVLLVHREDIFVGVGSDHTDRDLERQSIIKSKQICPNLLSRRVWRYKEVESRWDELLLQSWVKRDHGDEEILYQKAYLGSILSAADLLELVKSKMDDWSDGKEGLVIFSGTVPTLTNDFIYGSSFRGELIDSRLNRMLTCDYRIKKLDYIRGMGTI
jgi:hypothetical protein